MRRLAKTEAGFGLIELLIAMTVMVIAIMAIVAAFSSGMVALNRASRASTAATLADIQMEGFRKMTYASIAPTCASGTSAATDCFSSRHADRARRTDLPDRYGDSLRLRRRNARWDGSQLGHVYADRTGDAGARPVKRVTIVVYDPATTPPKELFRETSTFDQATG